MIHLSRAPKAQPGCAFARVALVAAMAVVTVPVASFASGLGDTGLWSTVSSHAWGHLESDGHVTGGGTHVSLLHGRGDSTWVIHWYDGGNARLWLAKPNVDSGVFVDVPNDTTHEFCSGHGILPDGRLIVVGGTSPGVTGVKSVNTFSPFSYGASSGTLGSGWSRLASNGTSRWYATVTQLGNGKILASSGADYLEMQMFGGRNATGKLTDSHGLRLEDDFSWGADPTFVQPLGRDGASAVFNYVNGRMVVYGGVRRGAAGQDSSVSDVVQLFRNQVDTGSHRRWEYFPTRPDSATRAFPLPRSRHTAVILGDTMIVYGGVTRTASGSDSVLSDVWRLHLNSGLWERVSVAGGPGPRYGHTAVLDHDWLVRDRRAMIVYGGRGATHALADPSVWALDIPRGGSTTAFQWTVIAPGPPPGGREGHAAVIDTVGMHTTPRKHRMFVFGGTGPAGITNDTWVLSRSDVGDANPAWSWDNFGAFNLPAPRTRHTAINDYNWGRIVVFGGDTNGEAAGGETNELCVLPISGWFPSWTMSVGDSTPSPRAGHVAVYDPRDLKALVPEIYDPLANEWEHYDDAPQLLPLYPFLFLMKSGVVFNAGNGTGKSSVFDLIQHRWSLNSESGFLGGSAVAFADLDKVMKCGGDDDLAAETRTGVATYHPNDPATWQTTAPIPEPRKFHNLTLLPDGKVLMTGGKRGGLKTGNNELLVRNPRMWNIATATWGPSLAPDPIGRGYHSIAILLPDARVLTASGPPSDTLEATIFSPPYLFKDDSTPAIRPVITSSPELTYHGEIFRVDVASASAVDTLCLIRPGSVTHAFDQSQRYIALSFAPDPQGQGLVVHAPPDGNLAPPGDYMMFAVVNGVPSVARWIRVQASGVSSAPEPAGRVTLLRSEPNPFSQTARIGFLLPVAAQASVEILDLQGRRIRTLARGAYGPGQHTIEWDRRTDHGSRAHAGIYLCRLRAGSIVDQRRIVLLP